MAAAFPWVKPQFSDGNGKPLSGGKLYSYQAGTNTPVTTYTDSLGNVANPNPYILDSQGFGDIWLAPGSYKFILKDKDGVTIWTKDKVKPADGGGGGIIDEDYAFDGFSLLTNAQFTSAGLQDTLAKIIRITYTAPTISLTASGSGTVYEKGATVSSTTLSATTVRKSNDIDTVRFYRGASLLSTQASPTPGGGLEQYVYNTTFSDNTSFSAQVDDTTETGGGPTTVSSNTVSFTFVYPYFSGVGAAGLNAAGIAALTKDVRTSTATLAKPFTVNGSQKMYFAYPSAYGALTSILDASNFETILDWTRTTKTLTALDGSSQSYYSYEFNNLAVANTYTFTFKR